MKRSLNALVKAVFKLLPPPFPIGTGLNKLKECKTLKNVIKVDIPKAALLKSAIEEKINGMRETIFNLFLIKDDLFNSHVYDLLNAL